MSVFAIIPAAGVGKRFGTKVPKQYLPLQGKTILECSLLKISACKAVEKIVLAIDYNDDHWCSVEQQLDETLRNRIVLVEGGPERADTVLNALRAISNPNPDDWVVVHDAVRPLVQAKQIDEMLHALQQADDSMPGGLMALPISDTVKQTTRETANIVSATLDRNRLWAAQTPQVFRYGLLRDALESTSGDPRITDESSAMEACGHSVKLFEGHVYNIKITTPNDLAMAELLVSASDD